MTDDARWTFRSTVTSPDGVTVVATITVPAAIAWKDVREVSELAQMVASRGLADTMRSRETSNERCPF
jgi:hypothetical protein